jgi:acetyl-CoA carboxylase biotin carboxyl carrier protein
VSASAFDFQDLLQLVELIKSSSQFTEFKLRANGIELELRRGPSGDPQPAAVPAAVAPSTPAVPAAPAPAAPLPPAAPSPRPAALADGVLVTSPMVGTVYLAPEPGAAAFVSVGQQVETDTQVCIVEVMKLMNVIPAGCAGVVRQILVGDAQAVEYGQPLFVIAPN